MPSIDPLPPTIGATGAAVADYRPPSLAAIVALALGLLSPVAFVGPVFWTVPAAAALAAATALRAMSQPGSNLIGRAPARAGLALGLVFGAAAPVESASARWFLARSADPFARAYLAELQRGQPQYALQFRQSTTRRRPLDERLWDYYREDGKARRELTNFVNDPFVKALLLLGERAEARLFEVGDIDYDGGRQTLVMTYAFTFDEHGQKTTMFGNVVLDRFKERGLPPSWRVSAINGPVRPALWEP